MFLFYSETCVCVCFTHICVWFWGVVYWWQSWLKSWLTWWWRPLRVSCLFGDLRQVVVNRLSILHDGAVPWTSGYLNKMFYIEHTFLQRTGWFFFFFYRKHCFTEHTLFYTVLQRTHRFYREHAVYIVLQSTLFLQRTHCFTDNTPFTKEHIISQTT